MNKHLIDLSDNQTFANGFPHEFFTWLRENHPVYWHEPTNITPDGEGFWVMSLYDDINSIMMDAKTFSSDKAGNRTGGGTAIKDEASAGKVLNQTDDPLHRRLRELANKGFTVKTIGSLEDELRTRTKRLLNSIKVGEKFDFARRIAREIPTQAICIVLGVPEDDRIHLCELIDKGVEVNSGSVIAAEYLGKVRRYAQALIEKKRAQPGDDIFSKIVHAKFETDGSTLSDFELRSFFALLFPAGAETTTRSISGGMLAFLEHPEQWRRLRYERELIKPAVEEIVRWTTPSVYKRRTATRAVDFRDKTIRPGDKVTVWEMSANRDERVFESPFEFNIARSPNRHLGFGAGVHFCLGAALARLELNIVFDEILLSELNFKPAGTVEWMPNNRLVGVKTMPVRVASRN